jgi:glycosyltransferase involved in cell wall biosynthesis
MRVTCLVKRWDHHTDSGGYDRLASAVGAKAIMQKRLTGNKSRVVTKLWNSLSNTSAYLLDYRLEDRLAELQLLARSLVGPPDVVHVLYGDEQLDSLLRWRRLLRCPLVATFHLPAKRTAARFEYFQAEAIKGIDAAIVLAKSEVASFQRWFGTDKVVFIPHGIDTTRFRPDDRQSGRDRLRLLIVGDHMRDWDVAHRVIDEAHHNDLDIHFDVVAPAGVFPYFTGCLNVTLHSRIPESELIGLYQAADALFLPLKGATANNSLLEALACGTPVIASDVGGIPDYMRSDSGWLIPEGDAVAAFALVKQLCVDKDMARSRRKNARAQALKFDWQRISERLSVVYSAVMAGRSPSAAVTEFEQGVRSSTQVPCDAGTLPARQA